VPRYKGYSTVVAWYGPTLVASALKIF